MTPQDNPNGPDADARRSSNPYSAFESFPEVTQSPQQMPGASHIPLDAGEIHKDALQFHGKQLVDGRYGDGRTPHPLNAPRRNGWSHTKGAGTLRIGDAFSWAFKTTFTRPGTWLVVGLLALVWLIFASVVPFLGWATVLLAPLVMSAALQQTLVRQYGLGRLRTPTYGKAVGLYLFVMVMFMSTLTIAVGIAYLIGLLIEPAGAEFFLETTGATAAGYSSVSKLLTLISLVLMWLSAPLYYFVVWYGLDNNGNFGHAIAQAFKDARRNYLPILGFILVTVAVTVIGGLLFILGLIVAIPVTALATAHAYRQISGGPVPTDSMM